MRERISPSGLPMTMFPKCALKRRLGQPEPAWLPSLVEMHPPADSSMGAGDDDGDLVYAWTRDDLDDAPVWPGDAIHEAGPPGAP